MVNHLCPLRAINAQLCSASQKLAFLPGIVFHVRDTADSHRVVLELRHPQSSIQTIQFG